MGLLYQPCIIDECEAVAGMRLDNGIGAFGENLPQWHFVHDKSYMT
jgi:hypothetical protein